MADGTNGNAGGTQGGNAGGGDKSQTSALGDDGATKTDTAAGNAGNDNALAGGEDSKAKGDEGKAKETAPADFSKLKWPEGVDPKKDALAGKFVELAGKLKLPSEQAQQLVELYASQQKASAEKALADSDAEQAEWKDLLKSDKEYGGEKYDASLGAARQAMAKYATPAFRQFLRDSGLGNHPELFRFVFRIGKEMADDTIGNTGGTGSTKPKTDAELLYGDTPAKQES